MKIRRKYIDFERRRVLVELGHDELMKDARKSGHAAVDAKFGGALAWPIPCD